MNPFYRARPGRNMCQVFSCDFQNEMITVVLRTLMN